LQPVSQTQQTTITFPQEVLDENPQLAGTEFSFPANTAFSDDGTRGGSMGIVPVPSDRLPSPLPPGLRLPFVFSLQTSGPTNFERPVSVCLPNLPDPLTGYKPVPGEKTALVAFNHDTGQWEVVGPMTVTADGNFMKSDPGVGLRQPGWGGGTPGGTAPGATADTPEPGSPCNAGSPGGNQSTCPEGECGLFNYGFVKPSLKIGLGFKEFVDGLSGGRRLLEGGSGFPNKRLRALEGAYNSKSLAEGVVPGLQKMNEGSDEYDKANQRNADCLTNCGNNAPTPCSNAQASADPAMVRPVLEQAGFAVAAMQSASANAGIQTANYGASVDKIAELRDQANLTAPNFGLTPNQLAELDSSITTVSNTVAELSDWLSKVEKVLLVSELTTVIVSQQYVQPGKSIVGGNSTTLTNGYFLFYELVTNNGYLPGPRIRVSRPSITSPILAPGGHYRLSAFDPISGRVGEIYFIAPATGGNRRLPSVPLVPAPLADGDSDGVSDEGERIVGTSPTNPDTDADGVTDGAELKNGSDPLSGLAVSTGVIARAPLTGSCIDIASGHDVLAAACGT
jgi:hypothetical protein